MVMQQYEQEPADNQFTVPWVQSRFAETRFAETLTLNPNP